MGNRTIDESEEELELLDVEGRVIGLVTRSECHSNPFLLHAAVHVFVIDNNGRIFLQKRSKRKMVQPGKWDTSVGGHVAPGEAPDEAASREMLEELGIQTGELEFLHRYIWRSAIESELVMTYRCQHEGPFDINMNEIEDGRFFTIPELHELKSSGDMTPNLEHELRLLGIVTM
jgi:isopentenyl-diphosphate delta-isomerase type 1